MSSRYQTPIILRIPQASGDYDAAAFNNIIRIIEENFRLVSAITLLRGNGIYLDGVPRDGHLLNVGEVYVDGDGFLRMVQEGDTFPGSITGTGSVGTLTV